MFWTLGLGLLALACGSTPVDAPTGSTCPQNSTLTYENFGKAFIDTNCLRHAARQNPQLATQAAVQNSRDAIDRAAAA
jgi:hypothetical protein